MRKKVALRRFLKGDAPLLDGVADADEVVVRQHDVGGFAGNIGAAFAHRDADIGGFERGRVVHPVARDGDRLAVGLQGAHDAQFVFRRHPREDIDRAHALAQFLVGEALHFRACDDLRVGRGDMELGGDCARRCCVVARNH
jgi:hypothetical protein